MPAAPSTQALYWPARTRPQLISIPTPSPTSEPTPSLFPPQQLFRLPDGIQLHRLSPQVGSA